MIWVINYYHKTRIPVGNIIGFKIPKSYIWINSLPVNAMGKVQKKDLRDKYDKILLG